MDLKTAPRLALDAYLTTLRYPIRLVERLSTGGDDTAIWPPMLAVDRAEAMIREWAGQLWRDDELTAEAQRIRLAADERERAMRLRIAAAETRTEADEDLRRRQAQAEKARLAAAREAEQTEARVEKEAKEREAAIAKAAAAKRASVEAQATAEKKRLAKQAKVARLQQLDREADVLTEETEAADAARAAQVLADAAANVKARRKAQ